MTFITNFREKIFIKEPSSTILPRVVNSGQNRFRNLHYNSCEYRVIPKKIVMDWYCFQYHEIVIAYIHLQLIFSALWLFLLSDSLTILRSTWFSVFLHSFNAKTSQTIQLMNIFLHYTFKRNKYYMKGGRKTFGLFSTKDFSGKWI